jgi:ADP-ribose pyrophosphatase
MPERTVSTRREFKGRLLSLRVDEVELESGRRTTREVVEHPGAVAILADSERTRQSASGASSGRGAVRDPAGTRRPGESALVTAQRGTRGCG